MRIQIKLPLNSSWPPQFAGKEVEVSIESIKFPDGTLWSTFDTLEYSYEIIGLQEKVEVSKVEPTKKFTQLKELFGQELKRLNIDFKE